MGRENKKKSLGKPNKPGYTGRSFKESLVNGKYTVSGEKPHSKRRSSGFMVGRKIHNTVI